jgi:hypothetical protein
MCARVCVCGRSCGEGGGDFCCVYTLLVVSCSRILCLSLFFETRKDVWGCVCVCEFCFVKFNLSLSCVCIVCVCARSLSLFFSVFFSLAISFFGVFFLTFFFVMRRNLHVTQREIYRKAKEGKHTQHPPRYVSQALKNETTSCVDIHADHHCFS